MSTKRETNPLLLPPFNRPVFTIRPEVQDIREFWLDILKAEKSDIEKKLAEIEGEIREILKPVFS